MLQLRVDNITNYAYVGNDSGASLPEKFIAYDPTNPIGTKLIQTGQTMVMVSLQTGLFCRLAKYPDATASGSSIRASRGLKQTTTVVWGMLGDQPTAATATVFTYMQTGLWFNGEEMVAQAVSYPLLWSNQTALPGSSNITVTPLPTGDCLMGNRRSRERIIAPLIMLNV